MIFNSKESKEVFVEKLQGSISAIINAENINSSVQEIVNCTFAKLFNEEDLIEYYGNKDKLVEKLLKNWGDHSTIGKDYEAFEKLVRTIITSLYDNIHEFIKTGKLISKLLKDTTEIKGTVAETNENVKQVLTTVKSIKAAVSPNFDTIQSCTSTIADDNKEYYANYTKALFMENAIDDNKVASLKNVFIEPKLINDRITLKDKLKTWRNSPNKNDTEYSYANASVFLLYGKAGVGKSSFTSHIIFENILGDKCHAIALRKCADKLNHKNAWQSVKEIYECSDDKLYDGTVLILDGLDEVCVLQRGFDGKAFIENLIDNLPGGVKILITSRNYEGYFNEIKATIDLTIATITWTNIQIKNWCESYTEVHACKKKWCAEFLSRYNKLAFFDKRKDIFCIPIILYICCVSEIDIEEHNSVAGIYDIAFRKIGGREHSRRYRSQELTESDKRVFDINWQYTKELAFQMFLNDTLESALDNSLVNVAKSMTAKICSTTEDAIKPTTERYYAVFHFVSKNMEGIEFAHKTVGEYFTAVKLYEDYFANTLTDMSDESIENMWKNIFQAFRYKKIPVDIMQYFFELVKSRKTTYKYIGDVKSYSEWRDCFIDSYYKGMQEQLLWKMITQNAEYILKENFLLTEQVVISFRNLTWLLTMIDFKNISIIVEHKIYINMIESFFLRNFNMDVNLSCWQNLERLNLCGGDLSHANFNYANLSYADLSYADLSNANLSNSNLNYADLSRSDLRNANFNYANLSNANLSYADLSNADLSNANLNYADFSRADLSNANFNYANLSNANLSNVNLNNAYLSHADLRFANFIGVHLSNADLSNADLGGALLSGINLINIHLLKTDLPKFDNLIKLHRVKLINPIIDDVDMTKYFYDSETNRIRPIK